MIKFIFGRLMILAIGRRISFCFDSFVKLLVSKHFGQNENGKISLAFCGKMLFIVLITVGSKSINMNFEFKMICFFLCSIANQWIEINNRSHLEIYLHKLLVSCSIHQTCVRANHVGRHTKCSISVSMLIQMRKRLLCAVLVNCRIRMID